MKLTYKSGIVLGLSLFTLAGCTSANSPEGVAQNMLQIEEDHTQLASEFNNLFELESNLQADFEQAMADDPNLESFANQDNQVFENIDQRATINENISDIVNGLDAIYSNTADYSGEELDQGQIQSLGQNLLDFQTQVNQYTENYQAFIEEQETYFTDIASAEMDIETFNQGIESLTSTHQDLASQAQDINENLTNLNEQVSQVQDLAEQEIENGGE